MICDVNTCPGCRYLQDEQNDQTSFEEFLLNFQHVKCKVVHLVHQQINKLQNTQYDCLLNPSNMHDEVQVTLLKHIPTKACEEHDEAYSETHDETSKKVHNQKYNEMCETYDELYKAQKETSTVKQDVEIEMKNSVNNTATALNYPASYGRLADKQWILRILNRIRRQAHLILIAIAIGIIAWSALVYGVFLGATICGSGRTCFASSLRYTHAKRPLF